MDPEDQHTERLSEGMSGEALLALAHDHGHPDVTESKLRHWYKEEDCLPRPRQVPRKGSRGSVTIFPAETGPQLLAMCRLMAEQPGQRPDFDALRVLLWAEGYAIPMERIRASIEALAFPASGWLRNILRSHSIRFKDMFDALEAVARVLARHLAQSVIGKQIRQRLPNSEDQVSLLIAQLQMLFGREPAFDSIEEYVESDEASRDKSLGELMRDAMGLERAQTDRFPGEEPWLPHDLTPTWIEMARSGVFSLRRARNTLHAATEEALNQARADREIFFGGLPRIGRGCETIFGENAFGIGIFRVLDEFSRTAKDKFLGTELLIVLILRTASWGDRMDEIAVAIRNVLPACDHLLKLMPVLHEELPDAARALCCDIRALHTREDMDRHFANLRAFYFSRKDDLDAFWARHPDLYMLPEDHVNGAEHQM